MCINLHTFHSLKYYYNISNEAKQTTNPKTPLRKSPSLPFLTKGTQFCPHLGFSDDNDFAGSLSLQWDVSWPLCCSLSTSYTSLNLSFCIVATGSFLKYRSVYIIFLCIFLPPLLIIFKRKCKLLNTGYMIGPI